MVRSVGFVKYLKNFSGCHCYTQRKKIIREWFQAQNTKEAALKPGFLHNFELIYISQTIRLAPSTLFHLNTFLAIAYIFFYDLLFFFEVSV